MIINAAQITQALRDPKALNKLNAESIQQLVEAHPYFLPARFLETGWHQAKKDMAENRQTLDLYGGNWIRRRQFLDRIQGFQDSILPEPTATTVPAEEVSGAASSSSPSSSAASSANSIIREKEDQAPARAAEPSPLPASSVEEGEEKGVPIPSGSEQDYFLHQQIDVPTDLESWKSTLSRDNAPDPGEKEADKSLMVMMSFSQWLQHIQAKTRKAEAEATEKRALRAQWQKEKLMEALEEENEEIPENVFEMAMSSIRSEESLISEALADILSRQGKGDKAIDMYKKLSLRNPEKSSYFAQKIENLRKASEK